MSTYNHVTSDCPECGEPAGLEANCLIHDCDDPKTFDAEDGSSIIWADMATVKGTSGQIVTCGGCNTSFQLRLMVLEEQKLPMGFFTMEEE